MRVHKQVSVACGGGTKRDIINALESLNFPKKATLKSCDVENFEAVSEEDGFGFSYVKKVLLFFEWDDDE